LRVRVKRSRESVKPPRPMLASLSGAMDFYWAAFGLLAAGAAVLAWQDGLLARLFGTEVPGSGQSKEFKAFRASYISVYALQMREWRLQASLGLVARHRRPGGPHSPAAHGPHCHRGRAGVRRRRGAAPAPPMSRNPTRAA
jgi:hypothetical protein